MEAVDAEVGGASKVVEAVDAEVDGTFEGVVAVDVEADGAGEGSDAAAVDWGAGWCVGEVWESVGGETGGDKFRLLGANRDSSYPLLILKGRLFFARVPVWHD